MSDSSILRQAVKIEKVNKKLATHFALCNGNKIRYLIALDDGKLRLSKNIATYSSKLGLLMKLLAYIPFSLLKVGKLGYFVKVCLHPAIQEEVQRMNCEAWNMIVGTYDEKQKLVLQCFNKKNLSASFVKIGNKATENAMRAEIKFLKSENHFCTFKIPKLLGYKTIGDKCPFNIQITEEFKGYKVKPEINEDIVKLYKELSKSKKAIDGAEYEFSHGDFAPWNLKRDGLEYVVFDWEHCGYRMKGFDLMHYATIIEMVINNQSMEMAFESGLLNVKKYIPEFCINKSEFLREFCKLRTQISSGDKI